MLVVNEKSNKTIVVVVYTHEAVFMVELKSLGNAKWEIPKHDGMNVPVRIYGKENIVGMMKEGRTFGQAMNVAKLPGIVNASFVMPDGHEGYGFPIGGVGAFDPEQKGVVSPGGVGYDINCGVRLILTNLKASEVKPKIGGLMNDLFKNIPSGVGSKSKLRLTREELADAVRTGVKYFIEKGYGWDEDAKHIEENGAMPDADPTRVSDKAMKRGMPQFGTLGAGNHFLEVQEVQQLMDEEKAKAFGLESGQTVVMLHCGSRGFGHQVCDDYVKVMMGASKKYGITLPERELCCAPLDSKEAQDYLGAMACAVNYAFCNRQVMTHWIRETFESTFGKKSDELGMKVVYDVCHNIAKWENHEVDGKVKRLCVHRKGATRAMGPGRVEVPEDYRSVGQPVLIPGSMGTASYVLAGASSASECFFSTCHGSGRVMSRGQAIRTYRGEQVKNELEHRGIAVRATDNRSISEEAPGAYKNVDDVVGSVEQAGISKIVARLVPMGVAKG